MSKLLLPRKTFARRKPAIPILSKGWLTEDLIYALLMNAPAANGAVLKNYARPDTLDITVTRSVDMISGVDGLDGPVYEWTDHVHQERVSLNDDVAGYPYKYHNDDSDGILPASTIAIRFKFLGSPTHSDEYMLVDCYGGGSANSGGVFQPSTNVPEDGQWHTLVARRDEANDEVAMWMDGLLMGKSAGWTSVADGYQLRYNANSNTMEWNGLSTGGQCWIGASRQKTADGWEGKISLFLLWARIQTDQFCEFISRFPFAVFEQPLPSYIIGDDSGTVNHEGSIALSMAMIQAPVATKQLIGASSLNMSMSIPENDGTRILIGDSGLDAIMTISFDAFRQVFGAQVADIVMTMASDGFLELGGETLLNIIMSVAPSGSLDARGEIALNIAKTIAVTGTKIHFGGTQLNTAITILPSGVVVFDGDILLSTSMSVNMDGTKIAIGESTTLLMSFTTNISGSTTNNPATTLLMAMTMAALANIYHAGASALEINMQVSPTGKLIISSASVDFNMVMTQLADALLTRQGNITLPMVFNQNFNSLLIRQGNVALNAAITINIAGLATRGGVTSQPMVMTMTATPSGTPISGVDFKMTMTLRATATLDQISEKFRSELIDPTVPEDSYDPIWLNKNLQTIKGIIDSGIDNTSLPLADGSTAIVREGLIVKILPP